MKWELTIKNKYSMLNISEKSINKFLANQSITKGKETMKNKINDFLLFFNNI